MSDAPHILDVNAIVDASKEVVCVANAMRWRPGQEGGTEADMIKAIGKLGDLFGVKIDAA